MGRSPPCYPRGIKINYPLEHGKITNLLPKRTFKMIVFILDKEARPYRETSCKKNCQRAITRVDQKIELSTSNNKSHDKNNPAIAWATLARSKGKEIVSLFPLKAVNRNPGLQLKCGLTNSVIDIGTAWCQKKIIIIIIDFMRPEDKIKGGMKLTSTQWL